MCSELTPRAPIPDTRIPQLMQPCFTDRRTSKPKKRSLTRALISKWLSSWIRLRRGVVNNFRMHHILGNAGHLAKESRITLVHETQKMCMGATFSMVVMKGLDRSPIRRLKRYHTLQSGGSRLGWYHGLCQLCEMPQSCVVSADFAFTV